MFGFFFFSMRLKLRWSKKNNRKPTTIKELKKMIINVELWLMKLRAIANDMRMTPKTRAQNRQITESLMHFQAVDSRHYSTRSRLQPNWDFCARFLCQSRKINFVALANLANVCLNRGPWPMRSDACMHEFCLPVESRNGERPHTPSD